MQMQRSYLLGHYNTCRTAFLCCDIQEKVRTRIENFNGAISVSNRMAGLHKLLTDQHSVFFATEHFPEKVGRLASEIEIPKGCSVFAKFVPPMITEETKPLIFGDETHPPVDQVVLWGLETHVCVLQTANALAMHGIKVAVLVDGCGSQQAIDHDTAILAMSRWENVLLTTSISATVQLVGHDPKVLTGAMHLAKVDKKKTDSS